MTAFAGPAVSQPTAPDAFVERPARAGREWVHRAIGSGVGLVGGTVFVLGNRVALPDPWSAVAVWAWLPLLALAVWAVFVRRPRRAAVAPPQHHRAGFIYLGACVGMVALIAAGRALLAPAGFAESVPAVVALAVGLHFVPFAAAFGLRPSPCSASRSRRSVRPAWSWA